MAIASASLNRLRQQAAVQAIDLAVRWGPTRSRLLARSEQRLRDFFLVQNAQGKPMGARRMRLQALVNLLNSYAAAAADGRIAPQVRRTIISTFIRRVVAGGEDRRRPFTEKHGFMPPTLLVIAPTKRCNLTCRGCYAASNGKADNTLPYDTLQWILDQKRSWGSHFTVFSGGEPLLYRSQGKDLFDVFRANHDDYFLFYTNGTLIDRAVAERLAELGNVTPAISVEGWERETDARRGRGVYAKILRAMENLRAAGVPFGISITATRENAEKVLSPEYVDHQMRVHGAVYGWIFQYMPIGRSYTLDLMVTAEQRRWMLERQLELIYKDKLFLLDFWNGGPMSFGCMAAGRGGGYFYIDWDGRISPCVFFPYSKVNVHDLRERGEELATVLKSGYFRHIRDWQEEYLAGPDGKSQNLFAPCPFRDHHDVAYETIKRFDAHPLDRDAETALADEEYHRRLSHYGEEVAAALDPVWDREADAAEPSWQTQGTPRVVVLGRAAATPRRGGGNGGNGGSLAPREPDGSSGVEPEVMQVHRPPARGKAEAG